MLWKRWSREPGSSDVHPLDVVAALLTCRAKLFSKGWGDEQFLSDLARYASFSSLAPEPISITWNESSSSSNGRDIAVREGFYSSPFGILPSGAATVHLRARLKRGNQAACVILAASRDEGYGARERIFGGLIDCGIDLYVLENPFYGQRRITQSASLETFSDHVLMNLASVWEARCLLDRLRDFYGKLAVTGYSMGGHMAAITAAIAPFPVACGALATGASAAAIYTQGLLSWSVDLKALAGEHGSDSTAKRRLQNLIEMADLTHHPPPLRSDATVIVGCRRDGYILASEILRLHKHWPNSTLRWLSAGHVTAVIRHRSALRSAVSDALEKL
jgi:esterase/lipase